VTAVARLPGLTLLACPPYEAALNNQSFETAVLDSFEAGPFPNGWALEATAPGPAVPVTGRRDGVGYRGAKSYHYFPTAGTNVVHSLVYRTWTDQFPIRYQHLRADTPFYSALAFRVTQGSNYKLQLTADFFNAAGTNLLQSFVDEVAQAAVPTDGLWRFVRSSPWFLSPATVAAVPTSVDLRLRLAPVAGNWPATPPIAFLDWAYLGLLADGYDLAGQQTEPMLEDKHVPRIEDEIENGQFEAIRLNTGKYRGAVKLSGLDEAGATLWRRFYRKVSGFEPFSVHDDLSRFDRGFFPRCITPPGLDGLRPITGNRTFRLTFPWEETT
jgi:hypothetical protein